METNKNEKTVTIVQRVRKTFAKVLNLANKIINKDFKDFITLEYDKVQPEEINDIKRLKYLKNLNLAETGYINTSVSELILYTKKKNELLQTDSKTILFGVIKVKEQGLLKATIKLGYNKEKNSHNLSFENHNNIPIWKPLQINKIVEIFQNLHPTEGNALQYEHHFLENTLKQNTPEESKEMTTIYSNVITESFNSNKYFENGLIKLNSNVIENPTNFLELPILFPSPQNENQIFKLTEVNNKYLVFQSYLQTVPKPYTEIYLKEQVEPIAKLKHNLLLGIDNGKLFIGKYNDKKGKAMHWETFDKYLNNPLNSNIIKYYLSKEIIAKKNFVIEDGAIQLENKNSTIFLKKHYKNGEWYYAKKTQNNKELNFRPLTASLKDNLLLNFSNSKNLAKALKVINTKTLSSIKI